MPVIKVALIAAAVLAGSAPALAAADPLAPTGRWSANTRGAAAVPPMGWNSWNAFETDIDEAKVIGTAEALVSTGLAKLGYRYVNIDDGWWLQRRLSDKRVLIRTNLFPSAKVGGKRHSSFRPFTDRIHAMGLKAGIYTDIGRNSCGQSYAPKSPNAPEGTIAEREIGLHNHIDHDIPLYFNEWGFDYIKVDACGIDLQSELARHSRGGVFGKHAPLVVRESYNRTDAAAVKALYAQVGTAIDRARPNGDYIFSICLWGAANVRAWGKDIGNLVRTSDDIRPVWSRMLHTFDSSANRALYAHPGTWNDPDMLFVGHGDFDENHLTEARSHFTLWAIINAPLLIGYDMRKAPKSLLDIWGNVDLIAANQDAGGHQAVVAHDSQDLQIFVKTLGSSDKKVVALFNRGLQPVDVTLLAEHLKFDNTAPIVLRDLWAKTTLEPFTGQRVFKVAPRETLVFEASGKRALADGHYLSELPGRINVAHDGVVQPQSDPMVHRAVNPWAGTTSSGTRAIYAGWGGAQADQTPYADTLEIAAVKYQSGIGILANSRMEVRNDGAYRRFVASVGVDDNTLNPKAAVVFRVYGDGRLLAESGPRKLGDNAVELAADISRSKIVELVAVQATGKDVPSSVTWGAARVLK